MNRTSKKCTILLVPPCLSFPLPQIALTWTAPPLPSHPHAPPPPPSAPQLPMPTPGTTGAHSVAPTAHPLADIDPLQPSPPRISISPYPPHAHDSAPLLRPARASEDSQSLTSSTRTKPRSPPTTPSLHHGDDGRASPLIKKDKVAADHARDRDRTGKQRAEVAVARDNAAVAQNKKAKEKAALAKWRVSQDRNPRVV